MDWNEIFSIQPNIQLILAGPAPRGLNDPAGDGAVAEAAGFTMCKSLTCQIYF
jgi:hypothetical protein